MDNNKIIDMVEQLNYELYDKNKYLVEELGLAFAYQTIGYSNAIKFCDIFLWSSDFDDRKWNDETNDYEPLEQYLRKRINDLFKKLGDIEF